MSTIEVTSPFDDKVVGTVPFSNVEEVKAAIELANDTFHDHKNALPKYKRIEILEKVAEIMSSQIEELTILCASEGGKPYMDSKVEIQRAINGVKLSIEALSSFEGTEIAMGHTASSANRMAYTFKEPIGVVAAVSAFNHPFNLAIHQVIPAIAVGCSVIIKPATQTPMSAVKLIEILAEAGLPKGWAQAVVCGREAGELLATSPKINFLTFACLAILPISEGGMCNERPAPFCDSGIALCAINISVPLAKLAKVWKRLLISPEKVIAQPATSIRQAKAGIGP